MIRLPLRVLGLTELFVSSVVHLLFGFYIFSTAVASDLSQVLTVGFSPFSSDLSTKGGDVKSNLEFDAPVPEPDMPPPLPPPPIVLGAWDIRIWQREARRDVLFCRAEKKDDHVLVPDLGSLTSIHDRLEFSRTQLSLLADGSSPLQLVAAATQPRHLSLLVCSPPPHTCPTVVACSPASLCLPPLSRELPFLRRAPPLLKMLHHRPTFRLVSRRRLHRFLLGHHPKTSPHSQTLCLRLQYRPPTPSTGACDAPSLVLATIRLLIAIVYLGTRIVLLPQGGAGGYGEEHSRICGHSRFGRIYDEGHYPAWDEHHPIHFVGHSAGAQVVRLLHQMLADKAFEGHHSTSADWVLSVTGLSGALNGTTRAYLDGMQPEDGRSMKSICLLQLCRLGVIIYDWFNISWLKNYYNFGFDHFEMGWKRTGIWGLADLLLGNTGPFASGDWILPDLTIQGSLELNSKLKTFPNTYYFSYATKRTRKFMGITLPSSVFGIHPLFFIRVLQMSQWRHPSDVALPYKGYSDEAWKIMMERSNTISMTHPRIPIEHPSHHVVDDSECHPLQPGIWYYKVLEADHIFFIVNRERAGVQFDLVYDSIFQRCRKHAFRTTPPPTMPDSSQ